MAEDMAQPRAGYRLIAPLWLGLAMSAALHGAAGALLIQWAQSRGALETAPQAISISTAPAAVLDAAAEQPEQRREAASRPAAEGEQAPQASTGPEHAAGTEQAHERAETAVPAEAPVAAQSDASAAVVTKPAESAPRHERVAEQDKPRKTPRQRQASTAGKGTAASSGRISASRGSLIDYEAAVRARIARHKPGGLPHRGTAVVSFAISGSGGLVFARLAGSSGNGAIDDAAVAAVRAAAPFPPPPDGRTFSRKLPFYFR